MATAGAGEGGGDRVIERFERGRLDAVAEEEFLAAREFFDSGDEPE